MELQIKEKIENKQLTKEASKSHCTKIMEVFGSWNILLWPFPIYKLKTENTIMEKELAQTYIK